MRSISFSRGPCCRRGAIELPLPRSGKGYEQTLDPQHLPSSERATRWGYATDRRGGSQGVVLLAL